MSLRCSVLRLFSVVSEFARIAICENSDGGGAEREEELKPQQFTTTRESKKKKEENTKYWVLKKEGKSAAIDIAIDATIEQEDNFKPSSRQSGRTNESGNELLKYKIS